MALFLTGEEREAVVHCADAAPFFWALRHRTAHRAESPGWIHAETTVPWWHMAAETLTDAAIAYALAPDLRLAVWLRDAAIGVARRPEDDWVGPPFRERHPTRKQGHLETAHLSWALAVVLDLAGDVFTAAERETIRAVLVERAMPLCAAWLDTPHARANWRCAMTAGYAVAAAVLDDQAAITRAVREFAISLSAFQADGSYGESLQYGGYAAFSLMLTAEAIRRRHPAWATRVSLAPIAGYLRWAAASLLYVKPLAGWGAQPRPRSVNFGDSGALFAPHPDLLLHMAARLREECPAEAGLARWLFDVIYRPAPSQGPWDRSTFGFLPRPGFLTLLLLPVAAAPLPPEAAGVPVLCAFECGDVIARDRWGGSTVLAVRGGAAPLNATGHLHGDLHSFILAHNGERLLVDPGHSCYRNLIRSLETDAVSHNTCVFLGRESAPSLQETVVRGILTQRHEERARPMVHPPDRIDGPLDRGARRLLAERVGPVSIIASECASVYGPPLAEFTRFWLLCGMHVVFVIDRIAAAHPLRTQWNWLLNNRDNELELQLQLPDRLQARRGAAGLKLVHVGSGQLSGPRAAFMHDAYHPLPAQPGEGRSGSGLLISWTERTPAESRVAVHAIAVDDYGTIADWHLRQTPTTIWLRSSRRRESWALAWNAAPATIYLHEEHSGQHWQITSDGGDLWHVNYTSSTKGKRIGGEP